jgi:hypothetical protein
VIVVLGILATLWQPLLLGISAFMTVRSPLEKADFILPLYHDSDSVSASVADLYRQRLAPRVVLHRVEPDRLEKLGLVPPPHEVWRKLLEARGVPARAIETIGSGVENDVELGSAVAGLARGSRRIRGIVVASAPGSRLSRDALRQGLGESPVDVWMHPVMPREIDERAWWRSRAGWIAYFDAYCLWLLGFIR